MAGVAVAVVVVAVVATGAVVRALMEQTTMVTMVVAKVMVAVNRGKTKKSAMQTACVCAGP